MRTALPPGISDHADLAYSVTCPPAARRPKTDEERRQRDEWLDAVTDHRVPAGYNHAYATWRSGLVERAVDPAATHLVCLARGELLTPLLVGHGNASPTEVGLTLHHTWGVPMIPGSALKGLVGHYLATTYGPANSHQRPDDPQHTERDRACFQPPDRQDGRVRRPPGDAYRHLFGAPDVDDGPAPRTSGSAGCVRFHDALLDGESSSGPFLMHDVLTPHHKTYCEADNPDWPNEYENPEPVPFVSVRPSLRFLFAVEGPTAWAELALSLLREALCEWGIGGKTARGYGRFAFDPSADAKWLEDEHRARDDRRLPTLTPVERWRILVARAAEKELLRLAQDVFRDHRRRSTDLESLCAGHALDADVEDEALRQVLCETGHVDAWRKGHHSATLGRSTDNLRTVADAVDPPPLPKPDPEWRKRLAAVDAKNFDGLKRLAEVAQADPGAWPIEAQEALLQRLRASLGKNPKPAKHECVQDFARHVGERRRCTREGSS